MVQMSRRSEREPKQIYNQDQQMIRHKMRQIQKRHIEEGKVDFKVNSEIKSETEREKKKYPASI